MKCTIGTQAPDVIYFSLIKKIYTSQVSLGRGLFFFIEKNI